MLFLFANLRKIKVKRNFYNKKEGSFDTTKTIKEETRMPMEESELLQYAIKLSAK